MEHDFTLKINDETSFNTSFIDKPDKWYCYNLSNDHMSELIERIKCFIRNRCDKEYNRTTFDHTISDNKVLRHFHAKRQYVIVTTVGNDIRKYIARGYKNKYKFDYTIKLNDAKKFTTEENAEKYMAENDIEGTIYPVEINMELIINE